MTVGETDYVIVGRDRLCDCGGDTLCDCGGRQTM